MLCSICGIYLWEKIDLDIPLLFSILRRRGSDGFGVSFPYLNIWKKTIEDLDLLEVEVKRIYERFEVPFFMLINFRAQPETEVKSSFNDLQPIIKKGITIVHNGSVDDKCYHKYIKDKVSDIDSEAIIDAYLYHEKNTKEMMENLIGGYALLLYDSKKDVLFSITDYKPIYNIYLKSGFILGSLQDLNKVIKKEEIISEEWQQGFSIKKIQFKRRSPLPREVENFIPLYRHPRYNREEYQYSKGYIVLASGGIDSSLTAWILGLLGYPVKLIHFSYGQKGQEVELFGLKKMQEIMVLKEGMDVELFHYDLSSLFKHDPSELIQHGIPITTGTSNIKSTTAWVSSRNLVFSSYAISRAEQFILSNMFKEVFISAGFFNLTESGMYPDNSEYFHQALNSCIKFGTICPNNIKMVPIFADIMKAEGWVLGDKLNFPFEYTVSCDEPILVNDEILLCTNCGSTKLSQWASQLVGIKDPRSFYHKASFQINYETKIEYGTKKIKIDEILLKLKLSKEDIIKIKEIIKENECNEKINI